jgi:hypothetical protein
MERRAQCHNKLLMFAMLFCACQHVRENFVNADTGQVTTAGGVTAVNSRPFTGSLFVLYPNGDTMFIQSYRNGKEHGWWKQFYPQHKLKEQRYFENGKKQGKYIAYWENGAQKLDYNFDNGEYEGACSEWLSNGILIKQMNYKAGYEEGLQRAWYDNGKIKSNYSVINGRRFGLLGTKNCVNVSDSVFNSK